MQQALGTLPADAGMVTACSIVFCRGISFREWPQVVPGEIQVGN